MKFRAAIFDFNGTVFWDTAFHDSAFDLFLERHQVQLTDDEKRIKIHGKPNADIMRGIFGNHLTNEQIYDMAQEKESIYRELCKNDLKFAPGAEDFFDFLKSNKVQMTIATSAGVENVVFYFQEMGLDRWFNFENAAFDNGTFPGKPQPDVFLVAANKLNVKAHETVIFEDSVAGILAAESAGAGKIYIVNSYGENYTRFSHPIITHFNQVDTEVFIH